MAAARRLGQHHRLLIADRDEKRLETQRQSLRSEGIDCSVSPCDITDRRSVCALAEHVARTGPLRAIAHVAALSPSMGDWRSIMTVNLVGARHVEMALRPLAQPGCAAIFISSLAAHLTDPASEIVRLLDDPLTPEFLDELEQILGEITPQLAYGLSKFAVNRMCRRFAADWGARQARIVSLSPGLIATPMGALEFRNQPAKYDLLNRTPVGREGTMVEIADAIEFLASARASFISGTDLLVDGGVAAALAFPEGSASKA